MHNLLSTVHNLLLQIAQPVQASA